MKLGSLSKWSLLLYGTKKVLLKTKSFEHQIFRYYKQGMLLENRIQHKIKHNIYRDVNQSQKGT